MSKQVFRLWGLQVLLIGKLLPPTQESQPHISPFDLAHHPGLFSSFEAVYKTLNEQPGHVIELFLLPSKSVFSPHALSLSVVPPPPLLCLHLPVSALALPSSSLTWCSFRLSFLFCLFYPHLPSVRFINQRVAPLCGSLGSNQIHFRIECV